MERLDISSRKLAISREIFMQKIDTIKDRNGMDTDLKETEDIKKR